MLSHVLICAKHWAVAQVLIGGNIGARGRPECLMIEKQPKLGPICTQSLMHNSCFQEPNCSVVSWSSMLFFPSNITTHTPTNKMLTRCPNIQLHTPKSDRKQPSCTGVTSWFGWGLGMRAPTKMPSGMCAKENHAYNLSTWCSGQSTLLYTPSRSARHGYFKQQHWSRHRALVVGWAALEQRPSLSQ